MTIDQATAALQAQQLAIAQGPPAFDETVPPGIVVSWSVPGRPDLTTGAVVDPGTTVQVVLSQGPQPRTVPSLGGLAAADAKAAVEALQLVYAQGADEFSDSVPAGAVIRQDPAAGAQVPRGGDGHGGAVEGPRRRGHARRRQPARSSRRRTR